MALLSPVLFAKAVLGASKVLISEDWRRFFQTLKDAIDLSARRSGSVVDESASVVTLAAQTLVSGAAGRYRVNVLLTLTQAATTSSDVSAVVRWTTAGAAQAYTVGPLTSNTAGDGVSDVSVIHPDEGTDITLETLYASVGVTPMQYGLWSAVEVMP